MPVVPGIILSLVLLGYIPAMVAAGKSYPFLRWYIFGVLVFPVALVCAVRLKTPVRIINVLSSGERGNRRRKAYRQLPAEKAKRSFSPLYIAAVFFTKLIFGAFSGLIAFALIRLCAADTAALRSMCIAFAIVHTVLLAVTEICRFSRMPVFADEITKRALQMFVISAIASLPMFFARNFITGHIYDYRQFAGFLCTLVSFIIFVVLIFRMQGRYYSRFSGFFDYCVLSLCSYTVFSAVTLVTLSLSKNLRWAVYAFAMQIQLFNFTYFSGIAHMVVNSSSIYLAALAHGIIAVLILLSGLRCREYKKKELAYRVEYRTKAFRTSQKRALRRHIPKEGIILAKPVK